MSSVIQDQLLSILQQQKEQFVSGEMIRQQLHVSRTAVWKQIKKLEELGYEIEASTKLGYKMTYEPDVIHVEQLMSMRKGKRFGSKIHYYDQVDSTQVQAKSIADAGAEEGVMVVAEHQSKGKGRLGRHWHSPAGKGLWTSTILRPKISIQHAPQLTLLTAVALCRALRSLTDLSVGIKWPNDLLINGKKISGILLESVAEEERLKYVIAGIGIDVNMSENDYDDALSAKATSLRIEKDEPISRESVLNAFLDEWESLFHIYENDGFTPIKEMWEQYALHLGQVTSFVTPIDQFAGIPDGLDDSGALWIKLENGERKLIFSAEMGEPR